MEYGPEYLIDDCHKRKKYGVHIRKLYDEIQSWEGKEFLEILKSSCAYYAKTLENAIRNKKVDSESDREESLQDLEKNKEDIAILQEMAKDYDSALAFLDATTLDAAKSKENEEDKLVLSTIHSVKGLEYDTVILLDCIDEILPSARYIGSPEDNEDVRCMYVAVTRAKNTLYIIIKKGICSKEDLKRNIDVMKAHRCPEELIRQILLRYRKFEKSISVPKTFYIDPDPKSKDASIFALALLNTLTNSATIFEGDKSVGKNVCAETLAMCLNMPYYMITFNRGMTADDIYGTKSTDNSAAELLTEELADAYLQVAAGNREIPATVEKAAKYEYLRAKASSVSIVQEESCLVEWIKNGGVMCFNEMNMAEANFFASFTNQLTDNTGFIDIPGYGHLEINPDCILIGTQNADYTGVCEQNDATMSRFGCIQFPYPKSIKAQLEATVGKDRLDKAYFKQTDELYKTLYAAVTKGMVENSCLNIRGFIRGLKGVAQVPGLSTLKRQIEIHVIDTCPVDDRLQLMQLVREKITL